MLGGNCKHRVDSLGEAGCVLLPQQIMQEDSHGVHAKRLGPTQLFVDLLWIERCRLPHLQFIDGSSGDVIAAHQPWLLAIPGVGLLFGPALWWRGRLCEGCGREQDREKNLKCFEASL